MIFLEGAPPPSENPLSIPSVNKRLQHTSTKLQAPQIQKEWKPIPPAPQKENAKHLQGIRVPSKPGYVKSPYAKNVGLVDIKGYAPGTQVYCPYTGKIFIVPEKN